MQHSAHTHQRLSLVFILSVSNPEPVGWKDPTSNPEAILVTHGHIDHCNALPMLLRCGDSDPAVVRPPVPHILALLVQVTCGAVFRSVFQEDI